MRASSRPNLLWLLGALVVVLVLVPPLGYALSPHVPEPLQALRDLYAAQLDLALSVFGGWVLPRTEYIGPRPVGMVGWLIIAVFWLAVSLFLWSAARWLHRLGYKNI